MTAPNPNETPKPPETPGSSAPPSGTASDPSAYRVPDNDPRVWARGKTYAELLGITEQLGQLAQTQQQQMAQMQQQYQPPAPPAFDPSQVRDEDLIDGKTMKQYLATAAQPIQGGLMDLYLSQAQFALDQVRAKNADAFQRYSGEIMQYVNNIPVQNRRVDNLQTVVNLVIGSHLADERQRWQTEMTGDPTLRSGGGALPLGAGRSGPVTESDEMSPEYRQQLKAAGITDATLAEFFASQGMDDEAQKAWYARAKKYKNVITERSILQNGLRR